MRTVGVLFLVLLIVGCGQPNGPAGETGDLDGAWQLIEGNGPEGPLPVPEQAAITLTIDGREWGGVAACNHYGGTVSVEGDRLRISDVSRTSMGCEPAIMEAEQRYLDAFAHAEHYEHAGGMLILAGTDVRLVYEHVPPEPDAALVGTRWQLTSLVHGTGPDGSVSSAMEGGFLLLADDGTFIAATGCRGVDGRYETDGDRLRFPLMINEDLSCAPDLDAQDSHVLEVLAAEPFFQIEGSRLLLTAAERGLEYRGFGA